MPEMLSSSLVARSSRRAGQTVYSLVALLSVLLFLVVGLVWIRSYFETEAIYIRALGAQQLHFSLPGRVVLTVTADPSVPPLAEDWLARLPAPTQKAPSMREREFWPGIWYERYTLFIRLPHGLTLALLGTLPWRWLRRRLRQRHSTEEDGIGERST